MIILIVLGLGGFIALKLMNESEPQGNPGENAEAMARKMLAAIDKPAWDSTRFVQWSFMDMHHYVWDKERHFTQVKWDKHKVLLDINQKSGLAYSENKQLQGTEAKDLIHKAWEYWCNDAFWLNAPAKIMDPGVSRSLVDLDDGRTGLKASYESGGVTPGDSYVWILDKEGLPSSYKMWVKVIPVGGLEATWEKWTTLSTGAKIATHHVLDKMNLEIPISNLKAGQTLMDVDLAEDPFDSL